MLHKRYVNHKGHLACNHKSTLFLSPLVLSSFFCGARIFLASWKKFRATFMTLHITSSSVIGCPTPCDSESFQPHLKKKRLPFLLHPGWCSARLSAMGQVTWLRSSQSFLVLLLLPTRRAANSSSLSGRWGADSHCLCRGSGHSLSRE